MILVGMCFSFGGGLAFSLYAWSAGRLFWEFSWMSFSVCVGCLRRSFRFEICFANMVCCRFLYLSLVYMVELINLCEFEF